MLAYTDTGSGKPILFLHGLGLNKNFWASTIAQLATSYRCIAVDLPGHGESRTVSCSGRLSDYATHIRGVIESLELNDVILVGHSMGGQISMILALQMPAVITKLVLVCPAGIEAFTPEEREKMRVGANAIWSSPVAEDFLTNVYAAVNPEIRTTLMQEHLQQQRDNFLNFSSLLRNSVSGMLDEPVFGFLGSITQPTLCMFSQLDTAIPNRYIHPQWTAQQLAETASSKIKSCTAHVFPMTGHYLPVDAPVELAKKIKAFV